MTGLNTETYIRWKNWGPPQDYGPKEIYPWDFYHRLLQLKSQQRIIEIGFGAGTHLHYLKTKGMNALGIEDNKEAVKNAKEAGLDARWGRLEDLNLEPASIDAVMGLDVIEHIPLDSLINILKLLHKAVQDSGALLFTFPNGASPFGRVHQNGDLTHVNSFTRSSLDQLACLTGWQVVIFQDAPEYFELKTIPQILKHGIRICMRWIIRMFTRAYFLDPIGMSIVAVLKKAK